MKQTSQPGYGDAKGLQAFQADHTDAVSGLLIHAGSDIRWSGEHILAIPWTMVTGKLKVKNIL